MSRLPALRRSELDAFEPVFEGIEKSGNIVPNSMLTMGRVPALLETYAAISSTIYREGAVPAAFKRLLAHVASVASGCRYCAAHNAARASILGVDPTVLEAVWDFEHSEEFS